MPKLHKQEHSPYSPRQLFALVADVPSYPKFIPWCRAARVKSRESDTVFLGELVVVFSQFSEKYTSRVTLTPPEKEHDEAKVDVVMVEGPFHHLTNNWVLKPSADGGTDICLDLDFQFKSRVLDMLASAVFARASEKMVAAFRDRADALYGSRIA